VLGRSPETLERMQRTGTDDTRGESGPQRKLSGESLRTTSSARVLVVEPVPVLRTIITRAFADRGHSVTAVATLEDMRRLLPSFDPHVIVCELTLPDGAGDNACRRLKVAGNKLRPVVLMSGVPENELMRRAMQAGADRFHCKSRGLSELIDVIEEIAEEIVF
jgi:CheY-like chemotaxis protein